MNINHLLKVSRLESLTDGIFAIAMTILILDLKLPSDVAVSDMSHYIISYISPRLIIYIGSFIILGTLWIAMNFQIGLLDKVVRPYLWAHIFYLMTICVVPFSAAFIANYPQSQFAISFYAVNLLCSSLFQYIIFKSAEKHGLNDKKCTPVVRHAIIKRIFLAPVFYVFSIFVAQWNISIAFLLLVAPPLIYLMPGEIDALDK